MCGFSLLLSSVQMSSAIVPFELNQQRVDAQLLVGKWKCQSGVPEYQIETSADDEYRSDGTYLSKSHTVIKSGQLVQKSEIQVQAKWALSDNNIRLSHIELKAVRSDSPQYEVQLKKVFQQFNWAENRILSLSSGLMAFLPVAPRASDLPILCQKH